MNYLIIRYPFPEDSLGQLAEGLWRRATVAGAYTPMEKRAFGIADDMYCWHVYNDVQFSAWIVFKASNSTRPFFLLFFCRYGAGLLFAYLAFVPFCEAGVVDSLSLQVIHLTNLFCSLWSDDIRSCPLESEAHFVIFSFGFSVLVLFLVGLSFLFFMCSLILLMKTWLFFLLKEQKNFLWSCVP